MYEINSQVWALEDGDRLSFVRDGGGRIQLFAGDDEEWLRVHTTDEIMERSVTANIVMLEVR